MANVLSAPAPLAGAPIAQSGVLAAVAAALAIADSTVENNFFNPNPLTINVGDTVRWTWAGGSLHSVTSVAGSVESFDSGDLPTGTFSHAFTHAGTFTYYCDIHGFDFGNGTAGGMFAKIKVNAGIERPAYSGFSGAGTATPSRHRINNPRAGRTWRRRVNLGQ